MIRATFQAFYDHFSQETYEHHASTVTCSESKWKNSQNDHSRQRQTTCWKYFSYQSGAWVHWQCQSCCILFSNEYWDHISFLNIKLPWMLKSQSAMSLGSKAIKAQFTVRSVLTTSLRQMIWCLWGLCYPNQWCNGAVVLVWRPVVFSPSSSCQIKTAKSRVFSTTGSWNDVQKVFIHSNHPLESWHLVKQSSKN